MRDDDAGASLRIACRIDHRRPPSSAVQGQSQCLRRRGHPGARARADFQPVLALSRPCVGGSRGGQLRRPPGGRPPPDPDAPPPPPPPCAPQYPPPPRPPPLPPARRQPPPP